MFEFAGKWIDAQFIAFRGWLDKRLVPTWRVWWKTISMRLGVIVAALMTYLTAVPQAMQQALNDLPNWMRDSIPTWIGPLILGILFFARFWDQTAKINPPAPPPPPGPQHGAE